MQNEFSFPSAKVLFDIVCEVKEADFKSIEEGTREADVFCMQIIKWKDQINWLKSKNPFIVNFAAFYYGNSSWHPNRNFLVEKTKEQLLMETKVSPFPGKILPWVKEVLETSPLIESERFFMMEAIEEIAKDFFPDFLKEGVFYEIQSSRMQICDPLLPRIMKLRDSIEHLETFKLEKSRLPNTLGFPNIPEKIFPSWQRVYPEVKKVLIGAELLFSISQNGSHFPGMFIAAPYILCLEREMIQFFKHKFPKFIKIKHPDLDTLNISTEQNELKEMLSGSERISLGHFVNWVQSLNSKISDELLLLFSEFIRFLDPHNCFFEKKRISIISKEILPMRKYCVHISRLEKWPDFESCKRIRSIILFDENQNPGLLPQFIELEENILKILDNEK